MSKTNRQTDAEQKHKLSSASRHQEAMKTTSSDSLKEEIKTIPEKPTG